jgi:hypothetical protein
MLNLETVKSFMLKALVTKGGAMNSVVQKKSILDTVRTNVVLFHAIDDHTDTFVAVSPHVD